MPWGARRLVDPLQLITDFTHEALEEIICASVLPRRVIQPVWALPRRLEVFFVGHPHQISQLYFVMDPVGWFVSSILSFPAFRVLEYMFIGLPLLYVFGVFCLSRLCSPSPHDRTQRPLLLPVVFASVSCFAMQVRPYRCVKPSLQISYVHFKIMKLQL